MELVALGLGLGLAAGLSPGPLLALVVAVSLARGFRAGASVAIAPLLTDAPIILLAVFILGKLPASFLSVLGAIGGGIVLWLGARSLLFGEPGAGSEMPAARSRDLLRGVAVNFFNPHPWLFWATVQGPLLVQAWRSSPALGLGFLGSFYLAIVGSKMAMAALVAGGRRRLDQEWYRRLLRGCGALLIILGLWLVIDSVSGSFRT